MESKPYAVKIRGIKISHNMALAGADMIKHLVGQEALAKFKIDPIEVARQAYASMRQASDQIQKARMQTPYNYRRVVRPPMQKTLVKTIPESDQN